MSGDKYSTRDMRPSPRAWKYANTKTGKVEFHSTEQAREDLRLVRAPAPASVEKPKPITTTKIKDDDSDG